MADKILSYDEALHVVQAYQSQIALLEQYAEECVEAAKAAMKIQRFLMNENPISINGEPPTLEQLKEMLIEEHSDITVAAEALKLQVDETIMTGKMQRWASRVML